MGLMKTGNRLLVCNATIALVASLGVLSAAAVQEPAPVQTLKGTTIRGCLTGGKLTHVEPADPAMPLPASLGVNGIRAIRGQLKALNGHQVELIGTVEGIGPRNGILVADSDQGRFYLGGGDPSLGEDFRRMVPPTFYAHTVRNLAPTCGEPPALRADGLAGYRTPAEPHRLHVPDVFAVLIEGNQPIFADLESAAKA